MVFTNGLWFVKNRKQLPCEFTNKFVFTVRITENAYLLIMTMFDLPCHKSVVLTFVYRLREKHEYCKACMTWLELFVISLANLSAILFSSISA